MRVDEADGEQATRYRLTQPRSCRYWLGVAEDRVSCYGGEPFARPSEFIPVLQSNPHGVRLMRGSIFFPAGPHMCAGQGMGESISWKQHRNVR